MIVRLSITEAKRNLGKIYRCTREGHSFVVTRYGKPIAQIGPTGDFNPEAEREAIDHLVAAIQSQRTIRIRQTT